MLGGGYMEDGTINDQGMVTEQDMTMPEKRKQAAAKGAKMSSGKNLSRTDRAKGGKRGNRSR